MTRVVGFIRLKRWLDADGSKGGPSAPGHDQHQDGTQIKQGKVEMEMSVLLKHGKTLSLIECWEGENFYTKLHQYSTEDPVCSIKLP